MRKSNGDFSITFGLFSIVFGIILIGASVYFIEEGIQLETVVGLIGIVSGIAGILMGISGNRKANLESVKEYFEKGDSKTLLKARLDLAEGFKKKNIDMNLVAPILNFYQQWGLLNRKGYLPIWVFSGASGVRVVEMYLQLQNSIIETRKGENDESIYNPYYAQEFELLVLRIFKRFRKNMNDSNLTTIYKDQLDILLINQH